MLDKILQCCSYREEWSREMSTVWISTSEYWPVCVIVWNTSTCCQSKHPECVWRELRSHEHQRSSSVERSEVTLWLWRWSMWPQCVPRGCQGGSRLQGGGALLSKINSLTFPVYYRLDSGLSDTCLISLYPPPPLLNSILKRHKRENVHQLTRFIVEKSLREMTNELINLCDIFSSG